VPARPHLTDGVVSLRPWRESDIAAAVAGHDAEIMLWFGQDAPPSHDGMREVLQRWQEEDTAGTRIGFVIEHDDEPVGAVEVRPRGAAAALSWWLFAGHRGLGFATRAVRLLVDYAIEALGARRVEAEVDPRNQASLRVATRAGLRREGVRRVEAGMADRPDQTDVVVLARLATDPPVTDAEGFRALLNSFLPRKRAISQLLVRDPEGRVLLCQLTYKQDWDLPGGVVEVGESPQLAVSREVLEELGLAIEAGPLLLTDRLPPWGGWDDAVCRVFAGGVHDESIVDSIVRQQREIRTARFCTLDEAHELCADFTARRVLAALRNVSDKPGPSYTESGI
jgi:RimJ/RimL family protein N-acetyltransferase/8-oxo-dGTP pyrophosphatase MutT (NUDIX family)